MPGARSSRVRLYVIRHGETDHNVARRIQGPLLDDPVNANGRAQARALEERFRREREAGLRLDAVYASPLKRAWETAECVARGAGAPAPLPMPGLIEFSWGIHLGKTETGETLDAMKKAHAEWKAGNVDHGLPEGESPRSAWERVKAAAFPVLEKHPRGAIAFVAHGRINKIFLAGLAHRDLSRMEDFPQGNTSVTLLERDDGASPQGPWRLVYVNRKEHLAGLPEGVPDHATTLGGAPLV
jgi:probable phosphoglycerate mutase